MFTAEAGRQDRTWKLKDSVQMGVKNERKKYIIERMNNILQIKTIQPFALFQLYFNSLCFGSKSVLDNMDSLILVSNKDVINLQCPVLKYRRNTAKEIKVFA